MSRSAPTPGCPRSLVHWTKGHSCSRTPPTVRMQPEPPPRAATQIVSTFSRSSPCLCEVKGCTCGTPRRPGSAVWKKRGNLNPFVYQESEGRANSQRLLEPWQGHGVAPHSQQSPVYEI